MLERLAGLAALLLIVACGEVTTSTDAAIDANGAPSVDSGTSTDAPVAPIDALVVPDARITGGAGFGRPCVDGTECMSGYCYDVSDYDPTCFGTGCTEPCTANAECIGYATQFGANNPNAAFCRTDDFVCDLFGTGLVPVACAAP